MRWRALLGGVAAVAYAAAAHAHAFLDHAQPAVGSAAVEPPARVQLWFTQRIEPAFSTIQVLAVSGERVDRGESQVGGDRTQLMVALKPLAPGRYKVVWRVVSVDTHVSTGDFSFEVRR